MEEYRARFWEKAKQALDRTGFLAVLLAKEAAGQAVDELAARTKELADLAGDFGLASWRELAARLELVLTKLKAGEIGPTERLAAAVGRAFELLMDAVEQETVELEDVGRREALAGLDALIGPASSPSTAGERLDGGRCPYEVNFEMRKAASEPNLFSVFEALASVSEVLGCSIDRTASPSHLRLQFRVVSPLSSQDLEGRLQAVAGAEPGLRLSVCPVFPGSEDRGREGERPKPGPPHPAGKGGDLPPTPDVPLAPHLPVEAGRAPIPGLPVLGQEEREVLRLVLQQQKEYLAEAASTGDFARRTLSTVAVLQGLTAYLGQRELKERFQRLLADPGVFPSQQEVYSLLAAVEAVAGAAVPPEAQVNARGISAAGTKGQEPVAAAGGAWGKSIRIDEAKVDRLLALAGELVITCNALPYVARRMEAEYGLPEAARELREHHASLDRLVRELQDAVMGMRLLPASFVFQKFPRIVRDLARELGKSAELRLEGEDTEIDKAVMQAIGEPLVHLVRNAMDHGLEPPQDRLRAGKPAAGTVTLRAAREGSKVVLEVEDDGKGIDVELVRQKAVAAGLVSEEEASLMTEDQVVEFLFVSGLSTAETVTEVSGRGVGMDAVRAAVQRLGGNVRVKSAPGAGTRVRLELPLTLATSRVLVVMQNGVRYGLPLQDVREMVKLPVSELGTLRGKKVAVLRGELVPVVSLGEFLGTAQGAATHGELCLVVLAAGYALAVDGFLGQEDIVLKPLAAAMGFDPCFAGAAILGDGSVLLVLDPYRISV